MKLVPLLLAMATTVSLANEQCVIQERVVTKTDTTVAERGQIRRDIVPTTNGGRRCIVDFRARVGKEWHTVFGEHTWDGVRPAEEACAMAVKTAEDNLRERLGRTVSIAERILVCKDRPELQSLKNTRPGHVGDAGQFRMHPQYPERFYHNGAQCRWFIEPAFNGRDIQTYQGVVCEVQPNRWVVVDKF